MSDIDNSAPAEIEPVRRKKDDGLVQCRVLKRGADKIYTGNDQPIRDEETGDMYFERYPFGATFRTTPAIAKELEDRDFVEIQ